MGLRGPLRNPNSRRGQAEIRRRQREAEATPKPAPAPQAPVTPECARVDPTGKLPIPPKCFNREQVEQFYGLVTDLMSARVPLERVDSHAIAMAVRCFGAIDGAQEIANNGDANIDQKLGAYRLMSAYSKDQKDWLQLIGATPAVRVRMGLKPPPEKKGGAFAALIARNGGRT